LASFFDADGGLLPSANTLYRPHAAQASSQTVLDHALHYAVYGGHRAAAVFLLERGADIDARPKGGFWDDFGGMTPLHMGVWVDQPDLVAFLLERGADPTLTD